MCVDLMIDTGVTNKVSNSL